MTQFFAFVLKHRYLTLGILGAITLFFVAQYPRARLNTDLSEMFLDDPQVVSRYENTIREFGSDEIILVAFDAGTTFSKDGMERLDRAVEELEAHPTIDRAIAVSNADQIRGTEDALIVRPYFDDMEDTDAWFEGVRTELAEHPLYRDLVVSRDGQTVAIVLELTVDDSRPGEAMPILCDDINAILDSHGVAPGARHLLGFPVNVAETIIESEFNMTRVMPVAILTVFFVGWLLFRALWPVLLTLGVAIIAVLWVIGAAILLSPEINILVTITPIVILVLAFADVIHMTNCYLLAIADGKPKEVAVLETASEVGPACMYTSVTTALGFASFASVPATLTRNFALLMGFGVGVSLLIAVTLVPVLFAIFPAPTPRRTGLSAAHGSIIDKALLASDYFARTHVRLVTLCALAVCAFAGYRASQLHVEVDFLKRFPEDHRARVAQTFLAERMAGANTAEVIISTPEPGGALDPEFLKAVWKLQQQILALPFVDSAVTLTDTLAVIHKEMNRDEAMLDVLPGSRELAAQYVLLYEMGGADDLERFVDFDRRQLRMSVRLNQGGMGEIYDAAAAILAVGEQTLPPNVQMSATGLMVIFGGVLDYLVKWQINGAVTAMLTITVVMLIAFRSVRVALASMVPNFLPIIIFFGTIHWFDDYFDTDYIVIAAVAMGIAVDDSIHFLNRYRIEIARSAGDIDEAIRQTLEHTGKPIIQTTLIIVLGFGAFNLCGYSTARAFGLMLGCTLVWALLADLLLIPIMIRSGFLKFPEPKAVDVAA